MSQPPAEWARRAKAAVISTALCDRSMPQAVWVSESFRLLWSRNTSGSRSLVSYSIASGRESRVGRVLLAEVEPGAEISGRAELEQQYVVPVT